MESDNMIKSLPPDKQSEVKKMCDDVKGLTLPNLDLGMLVKPVMSAVLKFVKDTVVPKLAQANPTAAVLLTAVLESIEKALA